MQNVSAPFLGDISKLPIRGTTYLQAAREENGLLIVYARAASVVRYARRRDRGALRRHELYTAMFLCELNLGCVADDE